MSPRPYTPPSRDEEEDNKTSSGTVDVRPADVRKKAQRVTLSFFILMLIVFGLSLLLIYREDKADADERSDRDAAGWGIDTNNPVFQGSIASNNELQITFNPDPFRIYDSTPEIDPSLVAKAMGEIRIANQYIVRRQWNWAEEHAMKALQIWENLNVAQRMLGVIYTQLGQFDQALPALEAALRSDPSNPETYNNLATVYMNRGNMNKAEEMLQVALDINPQFSVARYNLGLLYLIIQRADLAVGPLEWSLDAYPNNAGLRNNLAVAHLREGDYDRAKELLGEVVRRWPETSAAYFNMAIAWAFDGDHEKAYDWINRGAAYCSPLDLQNFMDDPDFDAMKSDPDYPARMAEIFNRSMEGAAP